MGELKPPRRVLLLTALFSRHAEALVWARAQMEARWGAVALAGEPFAFTQTDYYGPTMGTDLQKQLLVFAEPIDADLLPSLKLQTNAWEEEYATEAHHSEARPLNIDPGYVTLAKLVLATTKDRDHRIYLSRGIFAEVTLHFRGGQWRAHPWTYPDYQRPECHQLLSEARALLRNRLRGSG